VKKIAAYLIQKRGFEDVNRLHGGINNYVRFIKTQQQNSSPDNTLNPLNLDSSPGKSDSEKSVLRSTFIGKNFNFDARLENNHDTLRVTDNVLGKCHICKKLDDTYRNCANPTCNLLFIACEECSIQRHGCCSDHCEKFLSLPEHEKLKLVRNSTGPKKQFIGPRSHVSGFESHGESGLYRTGSGSHLSQHVPGYEKENVVQKRFFFRNYRNSFLCPNSKELHMVSTNFHSILSSHIPHSLFNNDLL